MGIMSRTGSRMAMRFCSGALGTRRRESRRSTRSTATTELRLSRNPPVFQPLSPERATGIAEAEGLLPSGGSSVVPISQLFLALAFVFPHSMQRVSRKRSDPESEGNREAQRITRSSHQRFSLCYLLDARSKSEFLLWKRGRDVLQSRSLLRLSGSERRRSSFVYFFHYENEL